MLIYLLDQEEREKRLLQNLLQRQLIVRMFIIVFPVMNVLIADNLIIKKQLILLK